MKKIFASLFMLLLLAPFNIYAEEDPLPQDQAFPVTAQARDANTIIATWKIADAYYLYHDKFSFSTDTQGVKLGTPIIPKGETHKDPYFGDIETHRGTLAIEIPYTRSDASVDSINLITRSQGCADLGLCYPPYEQKVAVKLPAATAATTTGADPIEAISNLAKNMGLEEEEEFLEPDKAFILSTRNGDNQTLIAEWLVADAYYMYKDKLKFRLKDAPQGISLGEVKLPAGKVKDDEYFGKLEVYYHGFTAEIPVIGDLKGKAVQIELVYQGCADAGLCYPPIFKTVSYSANGDSIVSDTKAKTTDNETATSNAAVANDELSEDEQLINMFSGDNLTTILTSLLGLGLLLAFTACMYPMIPIVSSIIIGQGHKATAASGFFLSFVYVQAMAITFGVIGAIFGYSGEATNIAASMQEPWVIYLFSGLFVLLALSMFGFYNIQIPSAIQSKLNDISNEQKGGSLIGVFIMGVLSALIIGPCGGPILLATIAGAAASNDPALGFLYMYVLAIGMGAPLLVVGAGGGKLLPHAGTWMDKVKAAGGIILLAVAIVFLERVLDSRTFMMLWAMLFMITSVYMGAFEAIKDGASGWARLFKGLGLIAFVYGIIILLGGLTGARNFNDPLHGSKLISSTGSTMMSTSAGGPQPAYVSYAQGKKTVNKGGLTFIKIKSAEDFDRELKAANKAGYTVMLDFYADWCTYCKQFDDYVFSEAKVQQSLSNTVLIQADITDQDDIDKALLKRVKVVTAPAILFYGTDGKEVRKQRVLGIMKADEFLHRVTQSFK